MRMRWLGIGVPISFALGYTAIAFMESAPTSSNGVHKWRVNLVAFIFSVKHVVKVHANKLLHHKRVGEHDGAIRNCQGFSPVFHGRRPDYPPDLLKAGYIRPLGSTVTPSAETSWGLLSFSLESNRDETGLGA